MIAFGPVPSRRLGYSLGINNIPPKNCSYDCLYCQVGRTNFSSCSPQTFYEAEEVVAAVKKRVAEIQREKGRIDYLTFVPDGEPTLDIHLAREISMLKELPYKLAVITNGSLLGRETIRKSLEEVDLVSVKVDSVHEPVWQEINRPNQLLRLSEILLGIEEFAQTFKGELITETMLLSGINDLPGELEATAGFLQKIQPSQAYIAIPTRPTSDKEVQAPSASRLTDAYETFSRYLNNVQLLTGFSEDAFLSTSNPQEEFLNIVAVHPMRHTAAIKYLEKMGNANEILENLIRNQVILPVSHGGEIFYLRKHPLVND